MKKEYVFNPQFETFMYRAYGDFSIQLSIITFLLWNVFSIAMQVDWLIILVINITLSFSFIGIPIKYIYYVNSLTISEESRTIKIRLNKFDRIVREDEYNVDNLVVKIVDHWFYRHTIYELRLFSNGKCICKQRETSNWKLETFKEIQIIIKELQQNIDSKI
jgi:hypothetical protein